MLTAGHRDKNLSSWSLRPWILLRHLGLPFEEVRLPLDTPQFRAEIGRWSPTGRVPVLLTATCDVWDSIAICEYANELAGGAGWPEDPALRAIRPRDSARRCTPALPPCAARVHAGASRGLQVPLTPQGTRRRRAHRRHLSDCAGDTASGARGCS